MARKRLKNQFYIVNGKLYVRTIKNQFTGKSESKRHIKQTIDISESDTAIQKPDTAAGEPSRNN